MCSLIVFTIRNQETCFGNSDPKAPESLENIEDVPSGGIGLK